MYISHLINIKNGPASGRYDWNIFQEICFSESKRLLDRNSRSSIQFINLKLLCGAIKCASGCALYVEWCSLLFHVSYNDLCRFLISLTQNFSISILRRRIIQISFSFNLALQLNLISSKLHLIGIYYLICSYILMTLMCSISFLWILSSQGSSLYLISLEEISFQLVIELTLGFFLYLFVFV